MFKTIVSTITFILLLKTSYGISTQISNYFSDKTHPLNSYNSLRNITDNLKDSNFVLIGGTVCGTSEFYNWQYKIVKELIKNHGYNTIFFEGEWLEWMRINEYIHSNSDLTGNEILQKYIKFWPDWRWKNQETADFIEWLKSNNKKYKVNLYGLDLFDIKSNIIYLKNDLIQKDKVSFSEIMPKFDFLDNFDSEWDYVNQVNSGKIESAGYNISQAYKLIKDKIYSSSTTEHSNNLKILNTIRTIKAGEKYLLKSNTDSVKAWNLRVDYMLGLIDFLNDSKNSEIKAAILGSNNLTSYANATEMHHHNQYSLGQLLKQNYGYENVFIIGMTSFQGIVFAAEKWGNEPEIKRLPSARNSSIESILFRTKVTPYFLVFSEKEKLNEMLQQPLSQRSVSVFFDPEVEREKNYLLTILPYRYDMILFFPTTRTVNRI